MRKIAIIPARIGSKRIYKKNIKFFFGKPIIAYSIQAAINSGLFDEIMVSTDSLEIAEIAKRNGASVPFFRTKKSSDDFATTYDVIKEVIEQYQMLNKSFDLICCIYACAPFVSSISLELGLNILKENKFDSVFPIVKFSHPIQRAFKYSNKKVDFFEKSNELERSQDLEKTYHDAGQFYWIKTDTFLEKKQIITNNSGSIILSELEAQDIDNETDWQLAEIKYELLQSIK